MSDNPMNINVKFSSNELAIEAHEILSKAEKWIFDNNDVEHFVGDYITEKNLEKGIQFDSYWIPNLVSIDGNTLKLEFVGSPGDDLPGDVIMWLGKCGANSIKGTLEISGTGDLIDIDHNF